jgi:hypothetical protein
MLKRECLLCIQTRLTVLIVYIGNCLRRRFKDDTPFIDLYSADIKWQLEMGFLLRQARARAYTHKYARAKGKLRYISLNFNITHLVFRFVCCVCTFSLLNCISICFRFSNPMESSTRKYLALAE